MHNTSNAQCFIENRMEKNFKKVFQCFFFCKWSGPNSRIKDEEKFQELPTHQTYMHHVDKKRHLIYHTNDISEISQHKPNEKKKQLYKLN